MQIEQLSCNIGAELRGINLADAIHDDGLFSEIRTQLLKNRVLFLRDQNLTRAEHVAFAERFGQLEDHPAVGSHPDHPGFPHSFASRSFPCTHPFVSLRPQHTACLPRHTTPQASFPVFF